MTVATPERHLFVIFGGTGDLARRKLIPALHRLTIDNETAVQCVVLGLGSRDMNDDDYRAWVRDAMAADGLDEDTLGVWRDEDVYYLRTGRNTSNYADLKERIERLEREMGLPGNRVFYLAIPPHIFPATIGGLGQAGLNSSPGWTRLVIEKPFGTDLESAHKLNETVHKHFDEEQVYRIDHYLGKETVQNLMAFRLSNPMFETLWHRDRVESVEINVAEDLGIEGRAGYYEPAGALRDMVQNHLTQVLALVAMEPPRSFDADQIRNEKVKVIEAIAQIKPENVVFGQYGAGIVNGEAVPGYREEDGVDPESRTPTFVGLKLEVDTWRWQGIPFYLRTGKRLPKRLTQVAVTFQRPPLCLFHGRRDTCTIDPDVLLITLQPDEGFTLHFNVKAPGQDLALDSQALKFSHADVYGDLPDAYQALILDIIEGDQTLFVRSDEVEASWRLYDPLLQLHPEPHHYTAGTWGPAAMDQGLALGGEEWMGR